MCAQAAAPNSGRSRGIAACFAPTAQYHVRQCRPNLPLAVAHHDHNANLSRLARKRGGFASLNPGYGCQAHRSTRKPGYRLTRRRRWPRGRRWWLRYDLQQRLRWLSDQERHFDRAWRQGRRRRAREKRVLRGRLIDGDLNSLRQETVLCKCHRLAFDSQREGARRLTRLALPGAHIGAARYRLELHGLRRRRRRFAWRQTEHQRRASCEGVAHRGRDSDEDESSAGHDRFGPES